LEPSGVRYSISCFSGSRGRHPVRRVVRDEPHPRGVRQGGVQHPVDTPHARWTPDPRLARHASAGAAVNDHRPIRQRGDGASGYSAASRAKESSFRRAAVVHCDPYHAHQSRPKASTQTTERSSAMGRDRLVRMTDPNASTHAAPSRFDQVTHDGDGRTNIASASSTASTAPPMKIARSSGSTRKNAIPLLPMPAIS
jgi:hypothetical protein